MGNFPTGGLNGNIQSQVMQESMQCCAAAIKANKVTTEQKIAVIAVTTVAGAGIGYRVGSLIGKPIEGILIGAGVGLVAGVTIVAINEVYGRNL